MPRSPTANDQWVGELLARRRSAERTDILKRRNELIFARSIFQCGARNITNGAHLSAGEQRRKLRLCASAEDMANAGCLRIGIGAHEEPDRSSNGMTKRKAQTTFWRDI